MSPLARVYALVLTCCLLSPINAAAFERGEVDRFATLPAGFGNPEGITADSHGNIYVTTLMPTGAPPGQLFVYNRQGHLERQVSIQGSSNLLLGLDFHPDNHKLLVIDFGRARVLAVNPFSGVAEDFAVVDPTAGAGLNALTFDGQGNVYISDSFRGMILRTGPNGGAVEVWAEHQLLRPLSAPGTPPSVAVPPFGANGLAFNKDASALFVANTGDDRLIKIPVSGGVAATPEVFVNSINGADGLIIDRDDNVWVAANQANEIVVVDKTGRVIAKLGDFDGLDRRGAPKGFLFPASLVRHDGWIYVTNLALDLRLFGHPTVDSQWAEEVRSHTISRIRARIPRIEGFR